MKKTLLTALLLGVLATGAGAQNAAIQGRVLDGGAPAEYATVLLNSNGNALTGTNTDEAGHFRFDSLIAGDYQLVIAYGEYRDTVLVNGIGSNETREIGDYTLNSSEALMCGRCCGFHYFIPIIRQDETSSGSFYHFEQIRHNPAR